MALKFDVCRLDGHFCTASVQRGGSVRALRTAIQLQTGLCPTTYRLLNHLEELCDEDVLVAAAALTAVTRSPEQASWLQELDLTSESESGTQSWLLNASEEALNDRDVILKAVGNYWRALEYASAELKGDREFILKAVGVNGNALGFASAKLQGDREVVWQAVQKHGWALRFASPELRGDRGVVLMAVGNCGYSLEHASSELKGDREVVLKAVGDRGWALQHASPELQGDRVVVLKAVQSHGWALEHASQELQGDWHVVSIAMARGGKDALRFARPWLRCLVGMSCCRI